MGKSITFTCLNCGENHTSPNRYSTNQKYCSGKCQLDYQHKQYIDRWKKGLEKGWNGKTVCLSRHIQRYLRELNGNACSVCGWEKYHSSDGNPLTEIDHINGDATDCREANLRILCPNCHSETSTFRARNKKSKRVRSQSIDGDAPDL